jgi:hypothetical protein
MAVIAAQAGIHGEILPAPRIKRAFLQASKNRLPR